MVADRHYFGLPIRGNPRHGGLLAQDQRENLPIDAGNNDQLAVVTAMIQKFRLGFQDPICQ